LEGRVAARRAVASSPPTSVNAKPSIMIDGKLFVLASNVLDACPTGVPSVVIPMEIGRGSDGSVAVVFYVEAEVPQGKTRPLAVSEVIREPSNGQTPVKDDHVIKGVLPGSPVAPPLPAPLAVKKPKSGKPAVKASLSKEVPREEQVAEGKVADDASQVSKTSANGSQATKSPPLSDSLRPDDKQALLIFFKISYEKPENYDMLPKKEKSAWRKANSLPRWAVRAVLDRPSNLAAILSGELTSASRTPASERLPVADQTTLKTLRAKWTAARAAHPQANLMLRPKGRHEKELKAIYDGIVKDLPKGKRPNWLPTPKKEGGAIGPSKARQDKLVTENGQAPGVPAPAPTTMGKFIQVSKLIIDLLSGDTPQGAPPAPPLPHAQARAERRRGGSDVLT